MIDGDAFQLTVFLGEDKGTVVGFYGEEEGVRIRKEHGFETQNSGLVGGDITSWQFALFQNAGGGGRSTFRSVF